jgi:hypothetical protein
VPERIRALVAEGPGIRRASDAEGVQNEEECARHRFPAIRKNVLQQT